MQSNDSSRFDNIAATLNELVKNQTLIEKRLAHLEDLLRVRPQTAKESEPAIVAEANVAEPAPRPPIAPSAREPGLESKVGLTLVNRIGVITLVLGVAFFFKWAVDNNWIGPAGRVLLGLLAGFATLATGDFIWRKRQDIFAQGITATGIAILYLAFYAAFDFYHLIPQSAAFVLMAATTAMAGVLSLRYKSVAIAALGLASAYATPLLLSAGEDHPWFLFSYLLLLNFAATQLGKRGGWPKLEWMSFGATTLIYGAWLLARGEQPQKREIATLAPLAFTAQRWFTQTPLLFALAQLLTACALSVIWQPEEALFLALSLLVAMGGLAFAHLRQYRYSILTAFIGFWFTYAIHFLSVHEPVTLFFEISCGFVLFLAWSYWHLITERAATTTLVLAVFALNGVVFYSRSYTLLQPAHHIWLGPLAALVAGVYLAFGLLLQRQSAASGSDNRPILLAFGIAISFLTLAIPIQFTGFTITIAWAIQGAALAWIGARLTSQRAVVAALTVFALGVARLALFEADSLPDPAAYTLLANSRFFTFAVAAVAMLLSSYWAAKFMPACCLGSLFCRSRMPVVGPVFRNLRMDGTDRSTGESFERGNDRDFESFRCLRRDSSECGSRHAHGH